MTLDATQVFSWNWERINEFVCRDFEGTQKQCIEYAKQNNISLLDVQPKHRWIVNQGGSRSSKNYSIAQALILFAMTNPGEVISVLRKNRSTVANTAMKDYIEVLKSMGVYKRKNHNLSKFEYTFPNGSIIEFFGVDNADKVMGRKRTICHVSEATEFWEEDKMQLEMRTEKFFICDFNPKEAISWVYDLPDDKKTLFKSTYKMNKFLSQIQIDDIEYLKETDEAMYTIYALGERAETRENVYQKWIKVDKKPEQFTKFIYAIDYGFTHPTAFVKIWYTDREIFVEEMFYLTNLTANDIISKFRELGITHQDTIIAEVARPEINFELRKNNFNIIDADKNVKAGINSVRSVKVYTNSDNVWREYQSYKWKKVQGKIVDEVVKHNDDAMDCFVASTLITTKRGQIPIIDVIPFEDYALTSNGWKMITDKFSTGKKQITKYSLLFDTNIAYLECTNNHLIKTEEEWKEISKLESGMILYHTNCLMEKRKLVAINAHESWEEEAFDITVDGEHEFFANGILVHNCIRYANLYIDKYYRGNTKTYVFH